MLLPVVQARQQTLLPWWPTWVPGQHAFIPRTLVAVCKKMYELQFGRIVEMRTCNHAHDIEVQM